MNNVDLLKLSNKLMKINFPLYYSLYSMYKIYSDREKISFIKQYLKPGMKAVDVGANVGFYSVLFSKLVGNSGKVYAFEPDKTNFSFLTRNTKSLSNVVPYEVAAGNMNQKIKLYYSTDLNVDHQTFDSGENRNFYYVNSVKIDDVLPKKETVDFIKIDIQGFDAFAIMGMEKIIKRSQKLVMFGEFYPYGLYHAQFSPKQYIDLLKKYGFTLKFFDQKTHEEFALEKDHKFYQTDFIATKTS